QPTPLNRMRVSAPTSSPQTYAAGRGGPLVTGCWSAPYASLSVNSSRAACEGSTAARALPIATHAIVAAVTIQATCGRHAIAATTTAAVAAAIAGAKSIT